MAHFAELDENNIVKQVVVVNNDELLENGVESEAKGIDFCESLFGGRWVQTSYNKNFRYHYAQPGYFYNEEADAFIQPMFPKFPSFVLNEEYEWVPPLLYPTDNKTYFWNEELLNWEEVSE